jgi:hypothetical protein
MVNLIDFTNDIQKKDNILHVMTQDRFNCEPKIKKRLSTSLPKTTIETHIGIYRSFNFSSTILFSTMSMLTILLIFTIEKKHYRRSSFLKIIEAKSLYHVDEFSIN